MVACSPGVPALVRPASAARRKVVESESPSQRKIVRSDTAVARDARATLPCRRSSLITSFFDFSLAIALVPSGLPAIAVLISKLLVDVTVACHYGHG
jgi:hypothetical protein